MLERFMKKFTNTATAEQEKEVINMTTENEATAQAAATTIAELTASLEQATATLADKTTAFAELTAKVEQMTAALAASESAQAELAAQAEAKVLSDRIEKLAVVIGTVKAPVMAASLKGLDDTSFDLVVTSMSANLTEEAKSAMFTETGVAADAEAVAEVAPTHFKTYIKKD